MLVYDLVYEELEQFIIDAGASRFRADQVWQWLYKHKVASFKEMTNIPADLIGKLEESFTFDGLDVVIKNTSADGTIKFLFDLKDNNLIETVLMNHDYGKSICVTTQVGCNIGCSFCASGVLKKKRDLSVGEIISQIVTVERETGFRVSSIVVMGIGEPFDNYKNLMSFLKIANHPKGLAIGARHITVSTSGLVPKIKEYAHMGLQINLAISLHAPNNEIRSKLMKINDRFPIEQVMDAIRYYINETNRRVTIEYIMIDGLNDSAENARELSQLLKGLNVYVNLIPYNEVKEASYVRSKLENREAFYDILKKNKIQVTLRKEQGHDINAACGQLRSQNL